MEMMNVWVGKRKKYTFFANICTQSFYRPSPIWGQRNTLVIKKKAQMAKKKYRKSKTHIERESEKNRQKESQIVILGNYVNISDVKER